MYECAVKRPTKGVHVTVWGILWYESNDTYRLIQSHSVKVMGSRIILFWTWRNHFRVIFKSLILQPKKAQRLAMNKKWTQSLQLGSEMEKFAFQKLERETKHRNNLLSCRKRNIFCRTRIDYYFRRQKVYPTKSEFINLLTTEEIPDDELIEVFNAFDCDGKCRHI